MKYSFGIMLMFVSIFTFAQPTVTEQFQKINTTDDAQKFIEANPSLKGAILHLSLGKDSTLIDKRLLKQNKGDVFSVGYVTYKVLDGKQTVAYRCNYVFLDGGALTPSQIDSMKKIIVGKYNAGTSFEQLSDQYTMDGNTTHGDTGWFFGPEMVPKELEDGVKNHKLGDVFYVDVSEKQWHYIVKKTYDDQMTKDIVVLRANGR